MCSDSLLFVFSILIITNCCYFHHCGIVILRCVSRTTLKTVSQLRTVYAAGIQTSCIYLYSPLQLSKLAAVFRADLVLKNSLGSQVHLIVYLYRTYASLSLIHLIIHVYHLTSILGNGVIKWIILLDDSITSGVLGCAVNVYLVIWSGFVSILLQLYLLLLNSLIVLILWNSTFTLVLYLGLIYALNIIFVGFLRSFPLLALILKVDWLI